MNTSRLVELVKASSNNEFQKGLDLAFIARAEEDYNKKRQDVLLIEQVSGAKKVSEVLLSNDEVKIYTISGKDEWDIKYPYRSIFLNKKGVWETTNVVSHSFDLAFLIYLQAKQLGHNSQFLDFAMKMLEIPNVD